jgi:adenosylcobinamide kinase / adenosylcobinamide-phosphate guanylyltransferase
MGHLLLVTGGTRSGKSRYAVERASAWGSRVLYVATCQPADDEMRQRS